MCHGALGETRPGGGGPAGRGSEALVWHAGRGGRGEPSFGGLLQQITTADRDRLKQSIQEQKSAWFATHPTITERFRAIEVFPDIPPAEPQSAVELFDDVPSLEKSLTDYLTGHAANSTAE